VNLNQDPEFKITDLEDAIADLCLILIGDDGLKLLALGTAVRIAPGLALTAKHVIWSAWTNLQSSVLPSGSKPVQLSFQIYAINFSGESANPAFWTIERVWGPPLSDLAILQVRPVSEDMDQKYANAGLRINALPPKVGDSVAAFGYPSSSIEAFTREPLSITFRVHALTTSGPVLQVFDNRRERGMLNFPCFEINARFEPGMSGGGVFNQAGELCGIICSALRPADGVSHIAYAATLWPVLGTPIDFVPPGCIVKGPYGLFELGNTGLIEVKNWEEIRRRVKVIKDEDGEDRAIFS
jgi:V8-like Glu-specific endopeptidase